MKYFKSTIFFFIVLVALLTSCTSPTVTKSQACENFCFKGDTNNAEPEFKQLYSSIVSAECHKIQNYEPIDSDTDIRISPICDGEDSYCDCTLDSGQSIWDIK
jgi:hypothetical protein